MMCRKKRAPAMGCSPHGGLDESSVWLAASAINPPVPELPHDDFRRTHEDFRRAHDHYRRRPDDDRVMMFISRVPALTPPAIRNKASGG